MAKLSLVADKPQKCGFSSVAEDYHDRERHTTSPKNTKVREVSAR